MPADLWIQASLEQRQRLQRLFFPEGVAFSGKAFDRTVVTSSLFEYLRPATFAGIMSEGLVGRPGIEPRDTLIKSRSGGTRRRRGSRHVGPRGASGRESGPSTLEGERDENQTREPWSVFVIIIILLLAATSGEIGTRSRSSFLGKSDKSSL